MPTSHPTNEPSPPPHKSSKPTKYHTQKPTPTSPPTSSVPNDFFTVSQSFSGGVSSAIFNQDAVKQSLNAALRDTVASVLSNSVDSNNILITDEDIHHYIHNNTLTVNYTVYYISIGNQGTFYAQLKKLLLASAIKSNDFVSKMRTLINGNPNAPFELVQVLNQPSSSSKSTTKTLFKCTSIKISHWSDLFTIMANTPTPEPIPVASLSPTLSAATLRAMATPAPSGLLTNAYFMASQEVKGISALGFNSNLKINSVFRMSVIQSMPKDSLTLSNIEITSVVNGDRNSLFVGPSAALTVVEEVDAESEDYAEDDDAIENGVSSDRKLQIQQRPNSIMVNYTVHYYTPAPHAVYSLLTNDLRNRVFGKIGISPTFNDILTNNAAKYPSIQPLLNDVTSNFVRISPPYFTNIAFNPTVYPTPAPKPWVVENTTLIISVSIAVGVVVMCLSAIGAYLYIKRLQKKDAFLKWTETYGSRPSFASSSMPQQKQQPAFGASGNWRVEEHHGGPHGQQDEFHTSNPAFGQVKRASVLPRRNTVLNPMSSSPMEEGAPDHATTY